MRRRPRSGRAAPLGTVASGRTQHGTLSHAAAAAPREAHHTSTQKAACDVAAALLLVAGTRGPSAQAQSYPGAPLGKKAQGPRESAVPSRTGGQWWRWRCQVRVLLCGDGQSCSVSWGSGEVTWSCAQMHTSGLVTPGALLPCWRHLLNFKLFQTKTCCLKNKCTE